MKYSFFNSVNYDRAYSAEDWADYFKHFIGNGVYAKPDTGMQIVSSGGMDIKCLNGSCFINGYTATSDETNDKLTLEMGDSIYARYDTIVARLDLNRRDIHIDVVQGVPAETPEKPAHIRTETIYDLVLAYVFVDVGAIEISDADIEDVRPDEAVCGFVKGLVDDVQTGELFRQYATEWALLMAGVKLDEPAIIAAFNRMNSVKSVNGVFPVNGNVTIPGFRIITGTYTGTGSAQVIDLGFEPEAVLVCAATSTINSIDYMPFFAVKNSPASYQSGKYTILSVESNGFKVYIGTGNYNHVLSYNGRIYNYIAFKGE